MNIERQKIGLCSLDDMRTKANYKFAHLYATKYVFEDSFVGILDASSKEELMEWAESNAKK